MPYREKRIYSGDFLEVEIYPITQKEKNKSRKKKVKESKLSQKNLNDKNAKKHLIRLINTNFTDEDISLTLTYAEKDLPGSEEESCRDVANYIRRVKRYRKRTGLPELKYIAVIEYKESSGKERGVRIHHHIIMSGMDRDIAEQIWGKGRANADRLKADEFGYEAIARYITKDPKGSKRWTQSKNLIQPTVRFNDCKYTRRKAESMAAYQDGRAFEKLYPGYIFTEIKTETNDITEGTYLYIKMRKLQEIKRTERRGSR